MRLVQLCHPDHGRAVAVVDGAALHPLRTHRTVRDLARAAMRSGRGLADVARADVEATALDYDAIHGGRSPWRLLPPIDHPDESARCLVTGTGLTHVASARQRQAMHAAAGASTAPTDSMRMFEWGVAGGRPDSGSVGVQPEWFYKGTGDILRAHGEPLDVPAFSGDGGEEAEIAGLYMVADDGSPRRIGFAIGNEFSDHRMETENYLYLAPSKLRTCALGPELVLDAACFADVAATVSIRRGDETLWSSRVATGEANMSHSLANLEHHHFKHAAHRRPGDVHVHFFGADAFSFGAGVRLNDGDVMKVRFEGFGRTLSNPVGIDDAADAAVAVTPLA
ncbi:MAG: GguC protein [Planctomycetes bacterium]|nr:GguC protein [Planctomycetota bacterium]